MELKIGERFVVILARPENQENIGFVARCLPQPEQEAPLSRAEQEDCIRLILGKLEEKGFIHDTNRSHVTDLVHDLFGRLAMTERDRNFLLAVFSKAGDKK